MNRDTWDLIKSSKSFNVNVYRRGLTVLILSLGFSCFFGVLLFYIYLTEPENDYYATNGVAPPVKLTSMATANNTPTALLPPDPPSESEVKVIPQ